MLAMRCDGWAHLQTTQVYLIECVIQDYDGNSS